MHEQKLKMTELNDCIDPGTQLVKSLSMMIGTLQNDMEVKRASDQEIIKLVL